MRDFFRLMPLLFIILGASGMHSVYGQETFLEQVEEPLIQPEMERTPFDEAKINTNDFLISVFTGMLSVEDFGSNYVIGGRLSYYVNEDFFVEAGYGQADTQKTSYEKLSGAVELMTESEREYRYYSIAAAYNVLQGGRTGSVSRQTRSPGE